MPASTSTPPALFTIPSELQHIIFEHLIDDLTDDSCADFPHDDSQHVERVASQSQDLLLTSRAFSLFLLPLFRPTSPARIAMLPLQSATDR